MRGRDQTVGGPRYLHAYHSHPQVVKIDIDGAEGLVKRYSLRGLPYLSLFKDGEKQEGIEVIFAPPKVPVT